MSVTLDHTFFIANSDAIGRRQELERPQEFDRDLALLVGINRYRNGIQSLSSPVSDATRIARLLSEEHGYAYHLCVENATLDHLTDLFKVKLPQLIGKDDRFLFYFAGHGIALENDAEGPAGYLVPEDADPTDRSTFLPMADLLAWLDALPCRHMLAILDCCFAGAIRWSSRRHVMTHPITMHRERYARLIESSAWQALTSAASDQTALDLLAGDAKRGVYQVNGGDDRHSPFAHALIRALAGEGDIWPSTGDGVITATELYLYLFQQVKAHSQTPGLWPLRKHTRGEFIFLKPGHKLQLEPAPPLTPEFSPWRGLEPYRTSDAKLFFGRTQAIQELVNLVDDHPLTAVVGVSGAGKTSLLQAGLRPHFQTRGWQVPDPIRPGATPLHSLVTALQQTVGSPGRDVATLLTDWFRAHPQQRLLLIIDPLEELIIECHDERQRADFQRVLAEVVRDHPHQMRVVVVLRADFERQFGESPLTPLWQAARYPVPSMTQAELREVIEQPAAERALVFEPPDLVDTLIDAVVGEPGALPLLAFTLQEMYMRYIQGERTDRALTPAHDREVGEVRGVLNQSANAVYEGLPDDDHRLAMQQLMLRTISVEGGHLARRRVPLIELDFASDRQNEQVREVRARMEAAYLLVPDEEAGRPYVEPAHDALVRHWDKMAEWQRMAGDSLPFQRRLSQAAWEWSQLAKRTGALAGWWQTLAALVRGWLQRWSLIAPEQAAGLVWDDEIRSSQLSQLLASPAGAWLSRIEREFARASIEQRQLNRRLRATVLTLLVTLLLAATVAAGVAIDNYIQTEVQRGETLVNESRLLTSLARQQRTVDPVASIHLALRALPQAGDRRPYWPDAELALTQAVNASRERGYLPVTNALAEGQVAFAEDVIAVGSQGVQLVDLEARQVTPITNTAVTLYGVAWGADGRLLAYDTHQVYIWQDGRWRASPVFTAGLSCARWRPGLPEIAICTPRGLQLWDPQRDGAQLVWDAHIDDAAWSPDGGKLAAWDKLESLLIWDAARGVVLSRQTAHPAHVNDAVWSRDGQTLISVSASITENVKLWSAAADWSPTTLQAHTNTVLGARFIPSTQNVTPTQIVSPSEIDTPAQFVTWSTDGTVRLWDIDGRLRQTFDPQAGPLARAGVAFSPHHTRFLILLETGTAQVAELKGATTVRKLLVGHERPIVAADWDGAYVATASRDGTIRVWDTDAAGDGEGRIPSLMVLYGHRASPNTGRAGVLGVRWQPDGTLASYGEDGTFRLWQIFDQQGQPRCRMERQSGNDGEATYCFGLSQALTGHDGEIYSAQWLDNDRLLTTGRDGTARRWSLATGTHDVLPGAPDENRTALWDPAGKAILTYYAYPDPEMPDQQDGTLWDAATSDIIARVPGPVARAIWRPGMLLVSGEAGEARIIDPATGSATLLVGQSALVNDAQAHGDVVAIADQMGQVGVWERTSGAQRWLHNEGNAVWVDRVQWHPQGTRLASVQNKGIMVWDAATGQPVWTWLDEGVASAVAFSPDGRQLAAAVTSAGVSGLAIFDAEGGELHWSHLFSRQEVIGVQWLVGREWDNQDFHRPLFNLLPRRLTGVPAAGDGTRPLLLTWGNDRSVRLWDVNRQAEVWRAEEGTTPFLNAAAVSPDGAHIVSVGMSGVVRVWRVPTLAPSTWPQIIERDGLLTRDLTE